MDSLDQNRLATARKRRAMGSRAPWHVGRMVTRGRALDVAKRLFPDEVWERDCKGEIGREGLPCRACASQKREWMRRVASVRLAMFKAFGP